MKRIFFVLLITLSLFGCKGKETVKVTFYDLNLTYDVDKGSTISIPDEPTKENFIFDGWYKDEEYNEPWNFVEDRINKDTILYAKWTSNPTLVYHQVVVDFGYDNLIETYDVLAGNLVDILDPKRDGFDFMGWLKDGEPFNIKEKLITENITLTATWQRIVVGTPIKTANELVNLFKTGGRGSYYLENDIDMTDVSYDGSLGSGSSAVVFRGVLDGNDKKINNLNVVTPSNKSAAMFGVLDGATIKNLIIMNSSIFVPGEASGFISASAYGGTTFENITFVNVTTNSSGNYAGLLYAHNENDNKDESVIIDKIVVLNDNEHELKSQKYVGGLIGYIRQKQTVSISNVYIKSNVVVSADNTAGAIIGRINNNDVVVNINNVYFEGIVSASNYVGGLIGEANVPAQVVLENILINNSTVKAVGSTVDLLVGRRHADLDFHTRNIFYNNSKVYSHNTTLINVPSSEASKISITEEWFNNQELNKKFFRYADGDLTHTVNLGEKVPERLIVSKSSYKDVFVYDVDNKLDLANLEVSILYSDGSTSLLSLEEVTINNPFDPNTLGMQTIKVNYNNLEGEFSVNVVKINSLKAYTYEVDNLFLVNQVDLSKVVVHAILSDGDTLLLNNKDLVITYEKTVGEQEVNIKYKDTYETKFNITIVANKLIPVDNKVFITVDKNQTEISGTKIGDITYVKSVKEAINLIEKSALNTTVIKKVNIKNGVYFEKLILQTPNVHFIGESQENTVIDYDCAAGTIKPLGGTWGTQNSATFSVTSKAEGFIAYNLTFSNSFDYYAATFSDKQAVAVLNEADKAIYYKVSFKGLQDTLYAKNGRQWYLEVYVEGIVDYIFGNGGPAFFESSEIHTLKRLGTSANGVITAHQGLDATGSKLIKYGYVFYKSTLTAGEGTLDGKVDLGRPWRPQAAVAFIENKFGSFVSQVGWVEMSGNNPNNANFYEYGNMIGTTPYKSTVGKQLTETEALNYKDKSVVFAKVNGEVTFKDDWNYEASLLMIKE